MTVHAFIFDMDGTLIDNMGTHTQVWSEYLAEHGVHITPERFFAFSAGRTNAEILRQLIGSHLDDAQVETMAAEKEAHYRRRYRPRMRPVDGLTDFLRHAAQLKVALAVASSAGHENIAFHLDGLGLRDRFHVVVGAEDVRNGKPHPDLFLTAAARLGIDPESCLVFEDTPAGLEAAQRAGMPAVALTTSYPAEVLAQYPAVVRVERDFSALSPHDFISMEQA
jgi:beta-phosphoglucomutase